MPGRLLAEPGVDRACMRIEPLGKREEIVPLGGIADLGGGSPKPAGQVGQGFAERVGHEPGRGNPPGGLALAPAGSADRREEGLGCPPAAVHKRLEVVELVVGKQAAAGLLAHQS